MKKLSKKFVYSLKCKKCLITLTNKAMKSVLLSNYRIKLYSTNDPINTRRSSYTYITKTCVCLLTNIICKKCGSIVGYNIVRPCYTCLNDKNNGHLWMFDISSINYDVRINGLKILKWVNNICEGENDEEIKIR